MQKVGANIANKDVSYVKCILLCEKKGLNERSCRVSES